MSILETVLIFVGAPLGITAFFAGMSYVGKKNPGPVPPAFHLGEKWTHEPVLWSAVDEVTVPAGHHGGHHAITAGSQTLIGGSAHGKW
ncbi:MAG: hypothetical protein GX610_05255 [Rhodococcus sp.]|nr:hypothetical protein [Rhodococcus sp. (in: high G+C Gram-positive bacteria)]